MNKPTGGGQSLDNSEGAGRKSPESLRDSPLLDPLRGIVRKGRAGVTRFLHPSRRRKVRSRLRELSPVDRVLVICFGNICRSPYGEARLAELGGQGGVLKVRSAGLVGPGRPSPENAQSAAKKKGLDLSDHISQLVTPEMVSWSEVIVVMDSGQARVMRGRFGAPPERIVILGDLDPGSPDRREIPDPVERPESDFLRSYERMDLCLHGLFEMTRGSS